jgi:hypothetical protein
VKVHATFATSGSDGAYNFWDKDSKQRLKVCFSQTSEFSLFTLSTIRENLSHLVLLLNHTLEGVLECQSNKKFPRDWWDMDFSTFLYNLPIFSGSAKV